MSKHRSSRATADWTFDRRRFLKLAAISSAAACTPLSLIGCGRDGTVLTAPGTFLVRIRRPEDLLIADITLSGLEIQDETRLVRSGDGPAIVVLHLPPQHLMEQSLAAVAPSMDGIPDVLVPENPPHPLSSGPLASFMAGPSRLAFRMPDGLSEVEWNLVPLLRAIQSWPMSVADNAIAEPGLTSGTATPAPLPPPPPPTELVLPAGIAPGPSPLNLARQRMRRTPARIGEPLAAALDDTVGGLVEPVQLGIPVEPLASQTSIEFPTRLQISPHAKLRFQHASEALSTGDGRVPLWYSELLFSGVDGQPQRRAGRGRTVRAIWTRDPGFDPANIDATLPGTNPIADVQITPGTRRDLVHLSSDFDGLRDIDTKTPIAPRAIEMDKLLLTGLGAYFDGRGTWDTERIDGPALQSLEIQATLGRHQYVKTVKKGRLFPWGHRASLIEITQRVIGGPQGSSAAYLENFQLIVLTEVEQHYGPGLSAAQRREVPFRSVTFKELRTPRLNLALSDSEPTLLPNSGEALPGLQAEVEDHDGGLHEVTLPFLLLVGDAVTAPHEMISDAPGFVEAFQVALEGQRFGFTASTNDADCAFETAELTVASVGVPGEGQDAKFLPTLTRAEISVEAARGLLGDDESTKAQQVVFDENYLAHGFDDTENPGELVFSFDGTSVNLDFGSRSDRSGGFVAPSMRGTGLSRKAGLVAGDLDQVRSGIFEPTAFFGDGGLEDLLPKLFGVVKLVDILADHQPLANAPRLVTRVQNQLESWLEDLDRLLQAAQALGDPLRQSLQNAVDHVVETLSTEPSKFETSLTALTDTLFNLREQAPDTMLSDGELRRLLEHCSRVEEALDSVQEAVAKLDQLRDLAQNRTFRLEWSPRIEGNAIFVPGDPDRCLVLAVEVRAQTSGGKPPGSDVTASLDSFTLNLLGDAKIMSLQFDRLAFVARAGSKPDIDVVFGKLEFHGPLAFIGRILDVLPLDGFSDPPAIDVTAEGLTADFSLPLPNLAIGIFSLENLSISAGLRIPFLGESLSLRFAFCSRENPFNLTVSMLGGGGYVGTEITPDGLQTLEVALEFGAALSMNFGVAAGGVSIMAGVYFALERSENQHDITLLGYLRIQGHVRVLGLVSASIELSMELGYEDQKLVGRASLRIEVRVLCFSAGVTLKVERRFKGSNGDPTFAQVMSPDPEDPLVDIDLPGTPWARYVNAFA